MTISPHKGAFSFDYHTETAATAIVELIQPLESAIARVNTLVYEAAATAHSLVFMKALGRSTLTAAAIAGATSLSVAATSFDPGQTLAANDYAAVKLASGVYQLLAVSNVSSLALTVNALDEAVVSGAPIFYFGAAADTGHTTLNAKASTVNDIRCAPPGGIVDSGWNFVSSNTRYKHAGHGRPILFYSANGTNAGFLRALAGTYNAW